MICARNENINLEKFLKFLIYQGQNDSAENFQALKARTKFMMKNIRRQIVLNR